MTYDSEKHHRRSIRLKGFDYSRAGVYVFTICVQDRACLFGSVVDGQMRLNDAGGMVLAEWNALPDRFPGVELDEFVVMPNHVHGIFIIRFGGPATVGAGLVPARVPVPPTVGDIVGAFKSLTTVLYGRGVRQSGWPTFRGRLWQRNFFDHIIRDDEAWNRIRQYILDNPARWETDRENPQVRAPGTKTA